MQSGVYEQGRGKRPDECFIISFHIVEKRCEPNPCQNNGFCHESFTTGDYRCECPKPYKGTNCEGQWVTKL